MKEDKQAAKIMEYMRGHWPSEVREEWRVEDKMYPEIVRRIVKEWTVGVSRERKFFRVAGQSGSGKTTQVLPAVKAWFAGRGLQPVVVAARKFVAYHPFAAEIEAEYGKGNLRKMTDEVSTILMFLTLRELIAEGYDVLLDVTLLDPVVEGFLVEMLRAGQYEMRMAFVAVSREISDGFIAKRKQFGKTGRVVAKGTADEFWRAFELALRFYVEKCPEMRCVVWDAWDAWPVFAGEISGVLLVVKKYWKITEVPVVVDERELVVAKVEYMRGWQ